MDASAAIERPPSGAVVTSDRSSAPAGIVFGPVPSRRLGCSLGINNVVGETCTYACVYCQAGPTTSLRIGRRAFHAPASIEAAVGRRLDQSRAAGQHIDYLTLVPSGEPTLDENLGETIRRLRRLDVAIAVVTNGSLLWRPDVRDDLTGADWVSVKVDTVREATWRRLNRPHGRLSFDSLLAGASDFARHYRGTLTTETMLVSGVNDSAEGIAGLAEYVGALRPAVAYVSIPLRPPAEPWVTAPDERAIVCAGEAMHGHGCTVRMLTRDADEPVAREPDLEAALLALATVHPVTAGALQGMLDSAHADWRVVERLVDERRLVCLRHRGRDFYRAHPRGGPRTSGGPSEAPAAMGTGRLGAPVRATPRRRPRPRGGRHE